MADEMSRVELEYLLELAEDPERAAAWQKAIEQDKLDRGARYGDRTIPTTMKPRFLGPDQRRRVARASRQMHGVLETFVELWLDDPDLQARWNVPEDEAELYRVDPGFAPAIQVARFDGFLDAGDLTFLEFNCDSPGGPGYGDVIQAAFSDRILAETAFGRRYPTSHPGHLAQLVHALGTCWASWRRGRDAPEEPFIVVTDWRDVRTRPDIDLTVEALEERGFDARFADPRDLELDGDRLVLEGRRVDMVYKRVILRELLDEPDASAVVEAYRQGTICMANPPRSLVVGTKKVLAALRWPRVQEGLSPAERRTVLRHVPWTVVLEDRPVQRDGEQVDLRDHVLAHREDLVLKPTRGYGGREVHLGPSTDPGTWGRLVDEHLDDGDWIVQELATIPRELFPVVADDRVELRVLYVNLNPFVFGGEYAGCYTRVSADEVINVSAGGGIAPTMTIEDPEAST